MHELLGMSLRDAYFALLSRRSRDKFLKKLTEPAAIAWLHDWYGEWARPEQRPPAGDWLTWLFLGGRGAGKTRAGAEWVRALALSETPIARIALVGETFADVRETMVDGISGLLSVHPPGERPRWQAARRRLVWPNGVVAQAFSSEDPEALRGPQFGAAWADELAKWRHAEECWDMLQFGLRLGERPRQLVTTTPRPIPLIRRLLDAPDTMVTRAGTEANRLNLAPAFLAAVVGRYGGTRLGRQELDGDIVDDRLDALWSRAMIEASRVRAAPELVRIVVAVDPAVSAKRSADQCGIVAAGKGRDGLGYVLADATIAAVKPELWAARALALYESLHADALVAEVNQGGDLVASVIAAVDPAVAVTPVRATRGKLLRAEPVAALYAQGRVRHVGSFPALEDEMCDFGADGLTSGRSPDRLDALVWAITALRLTVEWAPRVRRV